MADQWLKTISPTPITNTARAPLRLVVSMGLGEGGEFQVRHAFSILYTEATNASISLGEEFYFAAGILLPIQRLDIERYPSRSRCMAGVSALQTPGLTERVCCNVWSPPRRLKREFGRSIVQSAGYASREEPDNHAPSSFLHWYHARYVFDAAGAAKRVWAAVAVSLFGLYAAIAPGGKQTAAGQRRGTAGRFLCCGCAHSERRLPESHRRSRKARARRRPAGTVPGEVRNAVDADRRRYTPAVSKG